MTDTDLRAPATRRSLHRLLAGGLAAAAIHPMLASERADAAPSSSERGRGKRRFHRCKRHRDHTCYRARTCRHRHHKRRPKDPVEDKPVKNPVKNPVTPPGPYQPIAVPTAAALHLGSRFSYGMTPDLHQEMQAAGGHQAWFAKQLNPESIADPVADQLHTWWASIDLNAQQLWQRDQDGIEHRSGAFSNYQRWCLLRRVYSKRQVLEVVTEFFENHLHVPVHDDGVFGFRAAYGKLIRSHALGRFDEMLAATITHPAMGISLDNATSTKRAPNENLGRELLELHTVGRGNYTETDVKNSARILTGYRVAVWKTWEAWYDTASHWTGPVTVMGFSHPNASSDGRAVAEAYLSYLAHHPATARRLARKLAVRFVSDSPSEALVEHLASVYLANDTAIVPVLKALVAHPEFAASAGAKVRTPTDDVVATYRALDVTIHRPVDQKSVANAILHQTRAIGQTPFRWPQPDGQPETGAAWSSAARLLASFQTHYSMAGGWYPKEEARYHPEAHWVPLTGTQSMRFHALVDHLSRQFLCRPASQRILDACCAATGLTPETVISLTHALVKWNMPVLITTLLDSPEHMTR